MTDAPKRSRNGLEADPLADDMSFLIARANALSVAAGNEALADFGLRVRSFSALALAASDTRPNQREIAEFLRLDPSQVVALIDDLQAKGLVSRLPDPRDRRTNIVIATETGRELLGRAQVAVLRVERALHSDLSEDERATFARLLRRIAFASPNE